MLTDEFLACLVLHFSKSCIFVLLRLALQPFLLLVFGTPNTRSMYCLNGECVVVLRCGYKSSVRCLAGPSVSAFHHRGRQIFHHDSRPLPSQAGVTGCGHITSSLDRSGASRLLPRSRIAADLQTHPEPSRRIQSPVASAGAVTTVTARETHPESCGVRRSSDDRDGP